MKFDRQCRWINPRLPLLAGGELGIEERRKVERHLIACPDCRERRDASTSALAALRLLGEESPSDRQAPSLWPALDRQIRQSRHLSRPALAWWENPLPRSWSLASLATALGVVLVVSVGSPRPRFQDASPSLRIATTRPDPVPTVEMTTPMVAEPAHHRSSGRPALPEGPRPGELTQGALKPIEPPSSILRFDYDLDHGTPMTPGSHDPQRTF